MLSHDENNLSFLQKLFRRHPRYSLFAFLAGSPTIGIPLLVAVGLVSEFKNVPEQNPPKAINTYPDEKFIYQGKVLAELIHDDDIPIVKIYTRDPMLAAKAQAHLLSKHYLPLYYQFFQYLPTSARPLSLKSLFRDPWKHVMDETQKRQLDYSSILPLLHYILKEINLIIAEDNKSASPLFKLSPMTLDTLLTMIDFGDVLKGMGGGCSTAVLKDGTLIRNLDWETLRRVAINCLIIIMLTKNKNLNLPQVTASITPTPGIQGLTTFNDKGVAIALNETTNPRTAIFNKNLGAIPQFILINEITANCSTYADIKEFIASHQPASSHHLIVRTPKGQGVMQMLSPGHSGNYHFIGYDPDDTNTRQDNFSITNHNVDANGNIIPDTQTIKDSCDRHKKMQSAINAAKSDVEIAKAPNDKYTFNTVIAKFDDNKKTKLSINIADRYSATAIDSKTNSIRYSNIDLSDHFANVVSNEVSMTFKPDTDDALDKSLITLSTSQMKLGKDYPELAKNFRGLYSYLIVELTKHSAGQQAIPKDSINTLASQSIAVIDAIAKNTFDTTLLSEYKKVLAQHLPSTHFKPDKIIKALLAVLVLIGLLSKFTSLLEGKRPLLFFNEALNSIMQQAKELSTYSKVVLTSASVAIGAPVIDSYYRKRDLTFYANSIVNELDKIVQEKQTLTQDARPKTT